MAHLSVMTDEELEKYVRNPNTDFQWRLTLKAFQNMGRRNLEEHNKLHRKAKFWGKMSIGLGLISIIFSTILLIGRNLGYFCE